jgi:DNA-binding MarR family transcriptional regulator
VRSPDAGPEVRPDGGPALFRLVRFWSRRWARGVAHEVGGDTGGDTAVGHVLTVDAVAACAAPGATVGDVARLLGLDRSGASRMVAAAEASGFLERRRSESDARVTRVRLTVEGDALIAAAEEWQRHVFAELTAGWAGEDRERFAGYLQRLAAQVGA